MHQVLSVTVIFVSLILSVHGHTYHTGSCPSVEPERAFDMRRFLGEWYAIQKTSTASTCLIYNITMDEEPGVYKIEQTSQHFALGLTPLKHQYSYTGEITVPDIDVTGKMTVKFPLSVLGSSTFTVFMTDYVTYAGIFSCQKVGFAHRRSATILSRTKTLDKMYIDKLRTRLASFLVDPFDLSIINQTGCPKNPEEGVDLHIDDETFSAKSVANVIRKGGEKIGDGFEYVVGAGKKLYHRLRSEDSTHENYEVSTVQPLSIPSGEIDAEWVRF